ncbi:MAG: cytochrome c oxidase assembly protein [Acidimicrobiaceae bacterium]|nr:cytochrome c oxidase assembly protein [Acidimicrobiaceae bacterium]MCY4176236.1 cytochrome c oxidase assembly protein [Acidimicrobiaceae bacterium]MCY4280216.1 cytochrome c oxidase assembly protein [Acidimicrobiaceae bacterium]MCY4293602.1 cytochrome c oxidase assembly protein [Acidimicrobiaceae bacterium]
MPAAADAWRFQFHPEVWLMIAAIVGLGYYVVRVVAPVAAPAGAAVTRRQRLCFVAGVLLLWVSADWPMHDIAEDYLYSVHMVQHLLISFVVPPLLVMAVPEWLARLILTEDSRASRMIRRATHPLVAGVVFNALQGLMHWSALVDLSVRNGAFHYSMHLLMFTSALAMWTPLVSPLKEMQLSEPLKMLYLFAMSIVPTVPAGWLTFAEGSVYPVYDHAQRLWGVSVTADQQAAGAVMKVLGGLYLWTLIAIKFFRFSAAQRQADASERRRRLEDDTLTTADVTAEFERLGRPPVEHSRPAE